VVYGHWSKELRFTEDFMGNRTYGYKCSVCGKLANRLPFCGNCGAKMDESEDSGNV
jgi:DNA-directed RNA polymerase subunit RPC12/RpoP